jgi:hypothetical protein
MGGMGGWYHRRRSERLRKGDLKVVVVMNWQAAGGSRQPQGR